RGIPRTAAPSPPGLFPDASHSDRDKPSWCYSRVSVVKKLVSSSREHSRSDSILHALRSGGAKNVPLQGHSAKTFGLASKLSAPMVDWPQSLRIRQSAERVPCARERRIHGLRRFPKRGRWPQPSRTNTADFSDADCHEDATIRSVRFCVICESVICAGSGRSNPRAF